MFALFKIFFALVLPMDNGRTASQLKIKSSYVRSSFCNANGTNCLLYILRLPSGIVSKTFRSFIINSMHFLLTDFTLNFLACRLFFSITQLCLQKIADIRSFCLYPLLSYFSFLHVTICCYKLSDDHLPYTFFLFTTLYGLIFTYSVLYLFFTVTVLLFAVFFAVTVFTFFLNFLSVLSLI